MELEAGGHPHHPPPTADAPLRLGPHRSVKLSFSLSGNFGMKMPSTSIFLKFFVTLEYFLKEAESNITFFMFYILLVKLIMIARIPFSHSPGELRI